MKLGIKHHKMAQLLNNLFKVALLSCKVGLRGEDCCRTAVIAISWAEAIRIVDTFCLCTRFWLIDLAMNTEVGSPQSSLFQNLLHTLRNTLGILHRLGLLCQWVESKT